ncbi:DUF4282 domain-containing protein [Vibrio variabilis]|uniref:DUF4282 domain-containing protein n=1 Tax=Vibrio variabilis TaxID=990271 RepID=UPI000DD8BF49|nr:DUF4282 domain-containing protein [Vibrio variabilis]
MKHIIFLKRLWTPKLITLIYWFLMSLVFINSIAIMFDMSAGGYSIEQFLHGSAFLIGGALATRIWCEVLIVIFNISDNLQKLAEK